MSEIAFLRALGGFVACSTVGPCRWRRPTMDGKIKAPPPAGRIWLVGLAIFGI